MYIPHFLDLRVGFTKYFSAVPAATPELRDECFRIRHEVYCKELQYEPLRPDERETDAYDAHSVHCLLRANESGRFIGCIRLILPNPADPATLFPFEKTCATTLERDLLDPAKLPRERVAEVSRLAVVSAYRRRKSDQATAGTISPDDFGSPERPRFPYVTVGLYLGMIAQAQRFGIDTLFVLTEPRLARHLSLLGVHIKRIGGPVEHRGRRVPSMMSVPGIVSGFGPFVRPLYEQIAGEVQAGYDGSNAARARPAGLAASSPPPPFGASPVI
ncbi:MAG: PEP-CTERM/exosortase system-associated acyltransferase [Betaproteobacteria bacterium]|nr:PEP-CTERM/exosortase system-associated acyltransferase [Betaproteobacteria bacterium]